MRWLFVFLFLIPITVTGQQAECDADEFTGNIDCYTPLRTWYVTEGEPEKLQGFWAALSGYEGFSMGLVATGNNLQWETGDPIYFLYDGNRSQLQIEILESSDEKKSIAVKGETFDWLAAAQDVRFKIGNTEVFMPDKAIEDLRALKKLLTQE